jgi:hypothetical protein
MKKVFYYKLEDLPVIGEIILNSLKKDINDFSRFSPVFTPDYLKAIETKINSCKEALNPPEINVKLEEARQFLYVKSRSLHRKLNTLDNYFKLGADKLDVPIKEIGIKNVVNSITGHNSENLVSNMEKMMEIVKRNQSVLEAKGLKQKLLKDIELLILAINLLNKAQYILTYAYKNMTEKNIEIFNDLWENLQTILKTAKAIYTDVDDVKLKNYTMSQLLKQMNTRKKQQKSNK